MILVNPSISGPPYVTFGDFSKQLWLLPNLFDSPRRALEHGSTGMLAGITTSQLTQAVRKIRLMPSQQPGISFAMIYRTIAGTIAGCGRAARRNELTRQTQRFGFTQRSRSNATAVANIGLDKRCHRKQHIDRYGEYALILDRSPTRMMSPRRRRFLLLPRQPR